MSAPANSSAEALPSSSAGRLGVGDAVSAAPNDSACSSSDDQLLPVVGATWHDKYQILEQVGAADDNRVWRGRCTEGGQAVVLRAFRPAEPQVRHHVWSKLGGIDSPHLQHPRDALRAGEWRVEIANAPTGVPLPEWRAAQPAPDAQVVKAIVGQLADALAALHAFEIVHLGLRPDAIFIEGSGVDVQCVIAGLDTLTSFDRAEPLPMAVDPFYAPPESLGFNVHPPGPGLCAWDWWSLGRIVQELILGRHIVRHMANAAADAMTPDLRTRAETLLQDTDAKGPRAGAVELMPALDPALVPLLRGLLTSAQEARWTSDNVDRWVRGQPVKEHYDAPRMVPHFRWRGRPCTIPEIATILQGAEHWAENAVQLFEPTAPGTLAHYLRWSPTQSAAHEQLTSALELAESLPLKMSSPLAQRETVTMVALLLLSAGKLVWRGRMVEASTVMQILDELGDADGLMVLRALSTRSTAIQIERIDAATGRLLTDLGRITSEIEGTLRRYSWLQPTDVEAAARVFRLAVEPIAALRAARDALAEKFAGSDHPVLGKLFSAANAGRSELMVLAWVATAPERYRFFTHAEAARRRAEALRTRAVELTNVLVWARLKRALEVGRIVFGGFGWVFLTWLAAAAATLVLWPGPLGVAYAAAPAAVAMLFRILMAPRHARMLRRHLPEASWTWRDGPERCRRELRLAGRGVGRGALEEELQRVTGELAALKQVQPPPAPVPALPRFTGIRVAGVVSWMLLAGFIGVAVWRIQVQPPSLKRLNEAWAPPVKEQASADDRPEGDRTRRAEADDGETKIFWPYRMSEPPEKLSVRTSQPATSEQKNHASKHGREITDPYRRDTINGYIVMPVPADNAIGVMIYDGKRGELMNGTVYLLEYRPLARTWVDVDGRVGVYLDQ